MRSWWIVVVLLLHACANQGEPAGRSAAVLPAHWLGSGGTATVDREWWRGFSDPVLTSLVDLALVSNIDVRMAAARLQEARALADAQRGAALPAIEAGAGAERTRSISDVYRVPFLATNQAVQVQAAYEVDLWGRLDALTAAANASSAASLAARDAVALSVASTIASSYVNLRSLDAQLELARRTLETRERSATLIRQREQRGYASALESAQAEAEARTVAVLIPQLELAIQNQERAINVLLAQPPGPISRGKALLDLSAPSLPELGLPSSLVGRRPDIATAEHQLVAADAQLAAARAQLLPSLRLTASFGAVGSSVLNGDPFTVWSLGGSILAPLFNGGRLRSLAEASASRRDQALIAYERAVITALAEVEMQLGAYAKQREQLSDTEAQHAAVSRALRIAKRRFAQGYASYVDELLAQRNLLSVEQSLIQLRAQSLVTEINLYRALGGGWTAVSSES